jgi:hypothetical protein
MPLVIIVSVISTVAALLLMRLSHLRARRALDSIPAEVNRQIDEAIRKEVRKQLGQ